MIKKGKSRTSEWTPLKLDGNLFSGDYDGLIGIEELASYTLEDRKQPKTVSRKCSLEKNKLRTSKTGKRKSVNKRNEEAANSDEDAKPPVKKRHTDDNKKSKGTSTLRRRDKSNTESADQGTHVIKEGNAESNINFHSWTSLGVPDVIVKALADQNFVSPTLIQTLALPAAIFGRRDILGAAETGSGKTLAFGIPIVNGILELTKKIVKDFNECDDKNESNSSMEAMSCNPHEEKEEDDVNIPDLNKDNIGCVRVINNVRINETKGLTKKPLFALILTPTRELAIQIRNHLIKITKYTDIKIAVIVGGMAAVKQERVLKKGPEIVIATPGRLWELIQEGNPHLSQLSSISFLAIDETDRMLERGHFLELHSIIEKINATSETERRRQTFVFSATLTLVHDIPDYLQRKKNKYARAKIFKLTPGQKLQRIIHMLNMKNPKVIDITKQSGTADNLTECRISCTLDHKDYYLYYFLKKHPGRTLVFCNSIGCVKRLATLLNILNCNPLPLHANMHQKQRLKNLERFQAAENSLLIATDVAARGLDIPEVEHVIHFQVPRTSESYVHRSGRTARAQREGITVLMMEPGEKQNYSRLCKTLGRDEDLPLFPVIDRLLISVKERVDLAREIDKLSLKCKRDKVQKSWLQKAAEDLDIIIDENDTDATMEPAETADLRRRLKVKRSLLSSLLTKPLFPKGFSGKYPEISAELNLIESEERALDVMKTAIDVAGRDESKNVKSVVKRQSRQSRQSRKSKRSNRT